MGSNIAPDFAEGSSNRNQSLAAEPAILAESLMSTPDKSKCGQRDDDVAEDRWPDHHSFDQAERFQRAGYAKIERGQLFGDLAFADLQAEVARLEQFAVPRDFTMPPFLTPRKMSAIGGRQIRRESPLLVQLYESESLRSVVSRICGRSVYTCNDPNESVAINWQNGTNETHGWHLDESHLVLTISIVAPAEGQGGDVEVISGWRNYCSDLGVDPERDVSSLVAQCRAAGMVTLKTHQPGEAYLLRADENLHRVTPLTGPGARRSTLTLAFEFEADVLRIGASGALLYEA